MRDEIEIVNIGKCEHLNVQDIHSTHCKKRYFTFYDIKTFQTYKYAVCREEFRLDFHEYHTGKMKKRYTFGMDYGFSDWYFNEKLGHILKQSGDLKISNHAYWRRGNVFDRLLSYCVCPELKVYAYIEFQEVMQLMTGLEYSHEDFDGRCDFFHHSGLFESLKSFLLEFCDYCVSYVKYKKHSLELRRFRSWIKKNFDFWRFSEYQLIEFNQFLSTILEMQIKYKTK